MKTLRLIFRDNPEYRDFFWIMVGTFWLFTSINLVLLSQAASIAATESAPAHLFILSMMVMAIATLARQFAMLRTIGALEHSIMELRLRLLECLKQIELYEYECIGANAIYDKLSTGTRLLSETSGMITKLIILGARGAAVLFALVWISPITLFIVLLLGLAMTSFHIWFRYRKTSHLAAGEAPLFFETFEHLLKGFKEIKLNRRKGDELCNSELEPRLAESHRIRVEEGRIISLSYVMTEGILLILGGLMIYVFPDIFPEYASVAVKAALIVITLPTSMLRDAPVITNADNALAEISKLEATLSKVPAKKLPSAMALQASAPFQRLELINIFFRYTNSEGNPIFQVGPISLKIEAKSLNFIVGGNGSGKSTLMKIMTGLYQPFSGEIILNGQLANMAEHYSLFSVIFHEFHLFDRLYGMDNVDPDAVNHLLDKMELGHKTHYVNGQFSSIDLSAGQRKRLAMVMTMLENKPIYVLDEWAADQDPELRERFYLELLPALKAQGKTIIVITHDEHYFHLADQILYMEEGQLMS